MAGSFKNYYYITRLLACARTTLQSANLSISKAFFSTTDEYLNTSRVIGDMYQIINYLQIGVDENRPEVLRDGIKQYIDYKSRNGDFTFDLYVDKIEELLEELLKTKRLSNFTLRVLPEEKLPDWTPLNLQFFTKMSYTYVSSSRPIIWTPYLDFSLVTFSI